MTTRADAEDVMGQESAAEGGMVIVMSQKSAAEGGMVIVMSQKSAAEGGMVIMEGVGKGQMILAGTVMSTGIDIEMQTIRARDTARLQ